MKPEDAARVIEQAHGWLGTAYHSHGRVRKNGADLGGVDCATLLIEVYAAAGLISGHDPGFYAPDWHLHRSEEMYLAQIAQFAEEIDGPPQPGDLAVFKFGRCYAHGAIVVEWPVLIHSLSPVGVIRSMAYEAPLRSRPVKFFTLMRGA